jgi:hypothetical protein
MTKNTVLGHAIILSHSCSLYIEKNFAVYVCSLNVHVYDFSHVIDILILFSLIMDSGSYETFSTSNKAPSLTAGFIALS